MAHRTTLLRIVLLASVLVTSIGLSAQTKVVPPRNKYPLADDVRLGRDAAAQARKELPVMNDQVLDDWVKQAAQLSLGTAVRQQVVGREPAVGTVEYLAAMLNAVPRDEVYGLYIAFDRMSWRAPGSMPWVDRASWPKAAHRGSIMACP